MDIMTRYDRRAVRLIPTTDGVTVYTPADGRTYRATLDELAHMVRPVKLHHLVNGREALDWMRPADLATLTTTNA